MYTRLAKCIFVRKILIGTLRSAIEVLFAVPFFSSSPFTRERASNLYNSEKELGQLARSFSFTIVVDVVIVATAAGFMYTVKVIPR